MLQEVHTVKKPDNISLTGEKIRTLGFLWLQTRHLTEFL